MMWKNSLEAVGLCLLLTFPTFASVLHESLAEVPNSWAKVGAPASEETMVLQVALKQQNLDKLEKLIYDVSTPGKDTYGKYVEGDYLADMLAPKPEASTAVTSWLKSAGVKAIHNDGEFINFAASTSTMNKLLETEFSYYQSEGVTKLRTTGYSLPKDLVQHVDFIHPTTFFGKTTAAAPLPMVIKKNSLAEKRDVIRDRAVSPDIAASCKNLITPACIKQLYNIGTYAASATSGSKLGYGSFLNQSSRTQDLSLFETQYTIPSQGFSVQLINGGVNDQAIDNNHGEADLDIEYIIGTLHPLPVISYITGGSPPFIPNLDEPTAADNENEPYLNYYQYLLAQKNADLPQVITNSYGDDEQTVPPAYAKRVCNMIGQLGARGISVLESAGDTGVGAPCQSNDGKKTPQFTPQFPGTCPFITAVGGTQALSPEIAWVDGSGGFSNYFARPSYQDAAVNTYLKSHISPSTLAYYKPFANTTYGRGFPDISSHSLNPDYSVYVNNQLTLSGGTSAAAPVFSSIIALLNDARLKAGKPALGFLNPWLYSNATSALTDIVGGGSTGCTGVNGQTGQTIPGASVIPYASWNATVGWDPVTGLGTPNFQALMKIALA